MNDEKDWPEDRPIPLDHPLVPEMIWQSVKECMELGAKLHRVPSSTPDGYEYWLIATDGELIESFWREE